MAQCSGEKLEVTTTDDHKMIHNLKSGIHVLTTYFIYKKKKKKNANLINLNNFFIIGLNLLLLLLL